MPLTIAFLVSHRMPTALDLVGPLEVIARWPIEKRLHVVAPDAGLKTFDTGLIFQAASLDAVPRADIVVVPGGSDPYVAMADELSKAWLRAQREHAKWIASVCTGSAVLAAAGLLAGRRATTHWTFREPLAALGVEVVPERVVVDEPFISAAGVSAGIDMALELTLREFGRDTTAAIQLGMEYDPAPPIDAGSPDKAPPEIVHRVRERIVRFISAQRP
jgi:transcriptional regulator GlxA family with amidase domain